MLAENDGAAQICKSYKNRLENQRFKIFLPAIAINQLLIKFMILIIFRKIKHNRR